MTIWHLLGFLLCALAIALPAYLRSRPRRMQVARGDALDRATATYNMKRLPAAEWRGRVLPWRERDASLRARLVAQIRRRPASGNETE
jgi:hypothetical protein